MQGGGESIVAAATSTRRRLGDGAKSAEVGIAHCRGCPTRHLTGLAGSSQGGGRGQEGQEGQHRQKRGACPT